MNVMMTTGDNHMERAKGNENNETCMDVIEGMRNFVERQRNDPCLRPLTIDGEKIPNLVGDTMGIYWQLILGYANRFEKALKRMLSGLKEKIQKEFLCGSNYALRKAVQNIRVELMKNGMGPSNLLEVNIDKITSEALEIQVRNVDRFENVNVAWRYWILETQSEEYQKFIESTVGYDLVVGENWEPSRLEYFKFIQWLYAPW